jgi:4-hydroxybenzoate polyprenyltransferase
MRPYAWLWFDTLPALVLLGLLAPPSLELAHVLAGLFAIICADASVTTLNDVYDVETDRLSVEPSRNQRALVAGHLSPRAALLQVALLGVASLGLALEVGTPFLPALVCAFLLGVGYSVPPFRFSGRHWTAQPFWLLFGCIFYLMVASLAGKLYTRVSLLWLLGTSLFMALAENLAKDLRDWDNDLQAGKRTTVVALGPRNAALLSLAGCTAGSALYLALVWGHPELPLWARGVTSLLLAGWLVQVHSLVRRLVGRYAKEDARLLHVGYIRVFLAFNVLLVLGLHRQLLTAFQGP